jgi:hypothetical protein
VHRGGGGLGIAVWLSEFLRALLPISAGPASLAKPGPWSDSGQAPSYFPPPDARPRGTGRYGGDAG